MVDGDELRSRLEAMATADLVEALKRWDLNEWRPEVFPIVESILRARGVDVAALKASAERDRAAAREDDRTFVRVMELPDPGALAIAKSLLASSWPRRSLDYLGRLKEDNCGNHDAECLAIFIFTIRLNEREPTPIWLLTQIVPPCVR